MGGMMTLKPQIAALARAGLFTLRAHRCASSVALVAGLLGQMARLPSGEWVRIG
jgi:hypothetical protein